MTILYPRSCFLIGAPLYFLYDFHNKYIVTKSVSLAILKILAAKHNDLDLSRSTEHVIGHVTI